MESSEWSTNSKSSKLSASLCGLCGFSPPFNLIASAMSTDSRLFPRGTAACNPAWRKAMSPPAARNPQRAAELPNYA